MISPEQFFTTWLKSESAVTALIGTGTNVRLFPGFRPKSRQTYPAICYEVNDDNSNKCLNGGALRVRKASITLNLWSRGRSAYADLQTLQKAIVGTRETPKLDGFKGKLAGLDGLFVNACFVDDPGRISEVVEEESNASDDKFLLCQLSFRFIYSTGD